MHRRALLFVVGAAISACKSAAAKASEELGASISQMATAEAVAQAWAANRIPSSFAEHTLGDARKELVDNGETDAANVVTAIDLVIRRRERDGMEEPLAALRDQRQELEDRRRRGKFDR